MATEPDVDQISAAGFSAQGPPQDRSSTALQYQHYMTNRNARGFLGVGQRVAPDPSTLFSSPPVSGGQFGSGHAKSMVGGDMSGEEDAGY